VGEVVSRDFPRQEGHHHIEGAEIAMEFSCGFQQAFPVLDVLVQIVLAQLDVDLLQLRVEADHQFLALREVGHLVSDRHQSQFGLLQQQEGEEQAVGVVRLYQVGRDLEASADLRVFFEDVAFDA
jgi:hypothetical protein